MITKDRMFKMIISNAKLQTDYNYNASDYPDCTSGIESDNAVVSAIAMIVNDISADLAKSKSVDEGALYKKVFNHLNNNLIIYAD